MLQTQTVEPGLLDLTRRLQVCSLHSGFELAGGTGLALHIGHRKSVDIDLFSIHRFEAVPLIEYLESDFGFHLQFSAPNTVKGTINGIFVDIITHAYPYVEAPIEKNGIRLYSKKDIAAIKVNAITGNGTRVKDFIDLYFLLHEFTLAEILGFYLQKYPARNDFHALKSIVYFNDLDLKA